MNPSLLNFITFSFHSLKGLLNILQISVCLCRLVGRKRVGINTWCVRLSNSFPLPHSVFPTSSHFEHNVFLWYHSSSLTRVWAFSGVGWKGLWGTIIKWNTFIITKHFSTIYNIIIILNYITRLRQSQMPWQGKKGANVSFHRNCRNEEMCKTIENSFRWIGEARTWAWN